eukprot:UN31729
MLKGDDVLGCAPTGSGKTVAFVLPILLTLKKHSEKHVRALVVSPTRELSIQISNIFDILTKNTDLVSSYVEYKSFKVDKKKSDIIITTPLTIANMINKKKISLKNLEWLVLDEGDQLMTTGWVEQIDIIINACKNNENQIKYALFSATLHDHIKELVHTFIHFPTTITVGRTGTAAATIDHKLTFVQDEQGKLYSLRQAVQEGLKVPVLIFVQTKQRARELWRLLRNE